jgi:hypothetical protein
MAILIKTDGVVNPSSVSAGLKVSPSSSSTYTDPLSSLTVSGSSDLDGAVTVNTSKNNFNFIVKGDTADYLLVTKASSDRVGVNIQNPAETLDISGTLKVLSAAEFRSGATINSSQADSDFSVKTQNSTNTLYVDASTNRIGIGTDSPSKLLDVAGAANINSLQVNPAGVQANPSFQILGTNSTYPITVKSTSGPTFNGVGIFNTSPTVALDITGETKISGDLSVKTSVLKVDTSGNLVGINKTPTVALDVLGATKISSNLTVGSSLYVVSSSSYVGINQSSPTVSLEVGGSVKAVDYRTAVNPANDNAKLTKFLFKFTTLTLTLDKNTTVSSNITVLGAIVGDFVQVTYRSIPSTLPSTCTLFGYVSSSDTVTIVVSNGTDTDVASQSYSFNILVTSATSA